MRYRSLALAAAAIGIIAAACRSAPNRNTVGNSPTGALSSRGAVERFLAAVHAQDIQAMSVVWGTKDGPARDRFDREHLEKQEVILVQCLAHDSASFVDDITAANDAHHVRFVLYRGPVTRTTTFTTEVDPAARWYVSSIDLRDVHSCTTQGGQQPRAGAQ